MKNIILSMALAVAFSACVFNSDKGFLSTNGFSSTYEKVSETTVKKEVKISDVHKLEVAIPATVTYSTGAPSLVVSAPDNVMPWLKITVKNGELLIAFDKDTPSFSGTLKINVALATSGLDDIELSTATSFTADALDAKKLSCEITGASKITVDEISADEFDFEMSGASNFTCKSVKANKIDFEITGASKATVNKAKAVIAKYEVSGASNVKINQTRCNQLDAAVSGASSTTLRDILATTVEAEVVGGSSLTLAGKADAANLDATGASSINAKNLDCSNISRNTDGATIH